MGSRITLAVLALFAVACAHVAGVTGDTDATSWSVPGFPGMKVAIVTHPPTATAYGPQLVALADDGGRVLYEGARLFDVDFIHPTFFVFRDRTLVLADYGSEDAYGVLAWSVEGGGVRDLGTLDIARPEEGDVFTRGAAPVAHVRFEEGRYTIDVPGPLLLNPRGEAEVLLAPRGGSARWIETDGKLRMQNPPRTYSDVHTVEESGDILGTDLTLVVDGETVAGTVRHFEGAEADPIHVTGTLTGSKLSLHGVLWNNPVELSGRLANNEMTGTLSFIVNGETTLRLQRRD